MVWYVSLYTKESGSFKLLDFFECPNLEVAEYERHKMTTKYDTDFWYVESKLGSLDNTPKSTYHRREQYSHNAKAAQAQREGEERCKRVLRSIRTLKPTSSIDHIQSVMLEVRKLKPYLTVDQYAVLINEIERQPIIRKLLTKYHEATA
jgi:hypothetical protein